MLLTSERRDLYLPLDECEIPTDARAKLEALGITTVEELRAYWFYENRELLTEYLGDSPLNLVAMKPPAGTVRGMAARGPGGSVNVLATGPVPPLQPMLRGVVLPPSQRLRRAAAPSTPPATRRAGAKPEVKTVVSMTNQFPTPRNQGSRGTCVAFGSSVFKCKTSRIGPSGPWPSGGCARSSSRSLATPDSSPGSIGPTDSSLTSVHRYAW